MDLSDFDFELPPELIAQEPLADRAASRMLVVDRAAGRWEDRAFRDFPSYLGPGDCLVLNDSRVFPARLFGHRTGVGALPIGKHNPKRHEYLSGRVEVLLVRSVSADGCDWEALVRPGRKLRTGERIRFEGGLEAEILARGAFGERTLRFSGAEPLAVPHTASGGPAVSEEPAAQPRPLTADDLFATFERIGHIPLPPYIKRPDDAADRERYQTVFARERGSVAAPTAGLHFTGEILDACRARGAEIARVTLHVGLGTFQPLHAGRVEESHLHAERYRIGEEEAARLRAAGRVVAVGTTSVRTIESAWRTGSLAGDTDIFIYPGFEFRRTGALLTNFHLPRTSLLLLVCALAGTELALAAYRHAVEARYRFYSYGDCMLVV
jgi:S-adenosylmethionine:tRNA ribosyltransferase-isomerase